MNNIKKDILWRVYLVYFIVLLFSFFIIGQVIHIQFAEGDEWKRISEMQTLDTMKIEAIRGNICASDGSLMATSVPIFDIYWDSQVPEDDVFNKNVDSLAYCLSKLFRDKSAYEYKKLLTTSRKEHKEYILIKKSNLSDENNQITFEKLKTIKSFPIFRLGKNRGGLIVEQREKRVMPYKNLASRTIGFERQGFYVGLEGAYSKKLEGVSGVRLRKKIAGGIWMPINENEIEPQNGNDIITTIDVDIQDVAENALMKNLIANDADHGCAILMEVSTGHIKAIANLTRVSEGIYNEIYNYAIGESTEPGSTFKLFSVVAALDDEKINLDDIVNSGKTQYFDRKMKDSHEEGYGNITVRKAFEVSSNVGISQAIFKAYKDSPQSFVDKLYSMRIHELLGLDIGGEARPVIKNTKNRSWSRVTLPWMSIGYEVALTPLQILTFYNAIANNGKLVKPLFVSEIRKMDQIVESFKPVVLKDSICKKSTAIKARSLLEGVVENGTGKNLKNTVYKIAGKTGTAQVAKNSKGYGDKGNISYKASFVGYFPADNPKYSCIVVVYNPSKGAYYGGAVAAPVFKAIADRIFATHLDISQQKSDTATSTSIPFVKAANQKDLYTIYQKLDFAALSQNPSSEWVFSFVDSKNVILKEKPFKYSIVPNVIGMGVRDAVYLLEKVGLKVQIVGKGKVLKQSLEPGMTLKKGDMITLNLSKQNSISDCVSNMEIKDDDSLKFEKVSKKIIDSSKVKKTVKQNNKTDNKIPINTKEKIKDTSKVKKIKNVPNKKLQVKSTDNIKKGN